jgi:uncharacterized protein (TIGR04222 family)
MSLGPFDLTGGPFLQLYAGLLVGAIVAGFAIPRLRRAEGRHQPVYDADEIAYLAGGATRLAEVMVARLLARGALTIDRRRFAVAAAATGGAVIEQNILRLATPIGWRAIEHGFRSWSTPVETRLVAAGLIIDRAQTRALRLFQTAPYLLLMLFGSAKWVVGDLRGRPVGFLTGLLLLTLMFTVARLVSVDRRTRGGKAALADARARSERLRRAPTGGEADLAVAIFGTAVLVGSGWGELHQIRAASSSGGSCGSSCGGGGSGCGGGGGCGGCGS